MLRFYVFIILFLFSLFLYGESKHPRKPADIIKRIDSLLINDCCHPNKENFLKSLKEKGINYPIEASVFRVFKEERIMEIWAKNKGMKSMVKVMEIPIAAMDFEPTPKFRRGDHKTPEGYYRGNILYGSSNFFMWMKLNEEEIDEYGVVRDGSSFKICIDYPNNLDRWKSLMNGINTGGSICVHGNSVSDGCVSFQNRNFLPAFSFAKHHNKRKYGRIQYHIYPFKFNNVKNLRKLAKKYSETSYFTESQLHQFWVNLKEGYDFFNKEKNPIKWKVKKLFFRENDSSSHIKNIKVILNEKKLFNGDLSSDLFTSELKKSIKIFQKNNKLKNDGILGMKTLEKMGYIYGEYSFSLH